jgi:hypothetical protein
MTYPPVESALSKKPKAIWQLFAMGRSPIEKDNLRKRC